MTRLADLGKPPPAPFGEYWVEDGYGFHYRFWRYELGDRPRHQNAVYALVTARIGLGLTLLPLVEYIGRAEDTFDRLNGHERLTDAHHRGATELWIHRPGILDPIGFHEAESRLIERYSPPLNRQRPVSHAMAGLLGLGLPAVPKAPVQGLAALGQASSLGTLLGLHQH
ncbi:MAG: hypothetical protein K2Z25_13715 [Beijerinckiaceae bacterium]|nr:hypothetical protein [Beijerinckiaceae bacterium]